MVRKLSSTLFLMTCSRRKVEENLIDDNLVRFSEVRISFLKTKMKQTKRGAHRNFQ